MDHHSLQGTGQVPHTAIDGRLPGEREKALLAGLAQDDPEGALADLLAALEGLGLIVDGTTAT